MKSTSRYHLLKLIPVFVIAAGCDRPPTVTTSDGTGNSQRTEAQAFRGEVYRSADGRSALTLISADEAELRDGNTTLLCKYTRQADSLRVVVTAMGTNQVIYYRFTEFGLQDNEGRVFLSPVSYAAAMEQARLAREREENSRREAQVRQQQLEEQKRRAQEQLHEKSISMRNEGMEIVRNFFASGATIGGYYLPVYKKESEPFQVTVTGEASFSPTRDDPYDQDFSVPGHMKWLGASKEGHPFASSSSDSSLTENEGRFIGKVIVRRDGDQRELRLVVRFGVMDSNFREITARGNDSKWNGREFIGDFGDANTYYRQDGGVRAPETSTPAAPLEAESGSVNSSTRQKEILDRARLSDSKMAAIYSRLRSRLSDAGKARLKQEQLKWLKFRAQQTGSDELLAQGMNADSDALRRFTQLDAERTAQLETNLQSLH